MNIHKIRWALTAVFLFAMLTAHAGIWQENMQVELSLGERDTRLTVRAAALEEMRARASQKVGMIVESTMVSSGAKLTEEIRTISVSLMKLDNVKDELHIQKNGSVRLSVAAMVTVDTAELDRRAAAMRVDGEKADKIRQLSAENQTLRRSLDDINKQLGLQGTASAAADLLKRQASILDSISNNARRVGQTFEQGALLNLAQQDAQNWAAVKSEIDSEVFERLLATPVSANIVRVENNGNDVGVLIQVGWEVDQNAIYDSLSRHAVVSRRNGDAYTGGKYLAISENSNGVKIDRPFAEWVFRYLISHRVVLELSVGGVKAYVPYLYGSSDFIGECISVMQAWPSDGFPHNVNACISFQGKDAQHLRAMPASNTNPIRLAMTKVQARGATEVKATWILKRADGTEVRRPASAL